MLEENLEPLPEKSPKPLPKVKFEKCKICGRYGTANDRLHVCSKDKILDVFGFDTAKLKKDEADELLLQSARQNVTVVKVIPEARGAQSSRSSKEYGVSAAAAAAALDVLPSSAKKYKRFLPARERDTDPFALVRRGLFKPELPLEYFDEKMAKFTIDAGEMLKRHCVFRRHRLRCRYTCTCNGMVYLLPYRNHFAQLLTRKEIKFRRFYRFLKFATILNQHTFERALKLYKK